MALPQAPVQIQQKMRRPRCRLVILIPVRHHLHSLLIHIWLRHLQLVCPHPHQRTRTHSFYRLFPQRPPGPHSISHRYLNTSLNHAVVLHLWSVFSPPFPRLPSHLRNLLPFPHVFATRAANPSYLHCTSVNLLPADPNVHLHNHKYPCRRHLVKHCLFSHLLPHHCRRCARLPR